MVAAIIGFFTALPQLLTMIQSLMGWVNKVSGNDPAGFIVKAGESFKLLSEAETQEQHAAAAKSLADLIGRLPPR